jgi:hypothetical protein
MDWHIQCICLTDNQNTWTEVLNCIPNNKVKLDVFYHFEKDKSYTTIVNQTIMQKEMTGFLQTELKNWLTVVNQTKSEKKMLILYCHGNGWYFRHNEKILGFNYLFDCFKPYQYDLFYCMSCYVSTLEMLYECKDFCHYYIASEADRFNGFSFQSTCLQTLNLKDVAIQCGKNGIEYLNNQYEIGDQVCIDCRQADLLFSFIQSYPLTNCNLKSYIVSKIKPSRQYNNCCYDIYTFYETCLNPQLFGLFVRLFYSVVIYYNQSEMYKLKKSSSRCKGIAWCPVPWDSEHGWTYKYMKCYDNECEYWLHDKPIENFRNL